MRTFLFNSLAGEMSTLEKTKSRFKTKVYCQYRWQRTFIRHRCILFSLILLFILMKQLSKTTSFGLIINLDYTIKRSDVDVSRKMFFIVSAADINCSDQYNHICRFWFFIRCIIFSGVSKIVMIPSKKNVFKGIIREAQTGDAVIFHWRASNHSKIPIQISQFHRELLQYKHKKKNIRLGVLHSANERNRLDWPWYDNVDFVIRNYWTASKLPRHVQYIPLGSQFPTECNPQQVHVETEDVNSNERFIADKETCSCDDLELKRPSKRRYLWTFSGSLRRNRVQLLREINSSVNIRKKGFLAIAKKFGGDGIYGSKNKTENPKTAYLENMKKSIFVFCPCGNVMETHRIYESIVLGAIPVIENCEPELDGFFPFSRLMFRTTRDMVNFVESFTGRLGDADLLQREIWNWWKQYVDDLNFNVTNLIFERMSPMSSQFNY